MEGESKVEKLLVMPLKPEMLADNGPAFDRDKKVGSAMQHPELSVKTLGFFILCVYAHLILFSPVCEWTLSGNSPGIHDCSLHDLFVFLHHQVLINITDYMKINNTGAQDLWISKNHKY